ncbi:MAG TPA: MAPEG family protein [Allosphingosinicella sp.]|jgi:uncharacterized MAPEG superfamily protein
MTIAEWCLFGAVMLYLLTIAPAKAIGHRDFDNASPRDPAFYEHPVRKRALGAHINGLETFPFFAAAVLLAEFRQAPQPWIDALALGFLAARIAFVAAYLADKATLRTMLWNVAMAFNIGIFFLPAVDLQGLAVVMAIALGWALLLWPILAAVERGRAARR